MTKGRGSRVELLAGYQATSAIKCVEKNGAQNPSPRAMAKVEGSSFPRTLLEMIPQLYRVIFSRMAEVWNNIEDYCAFDSLCH